MQYKTINAAVVYEVSVPLRGYGFEIVDACLLASLVQTVSVPLRGYGFEIRWNSGNVNSDRIVSVPLRGYGFEIMEITKDYLLREVFPSPCGDVVLKLE